MSQYIVKGNRVEVVADGALDLQTQLMPNTYFIKFENSPHFQGFYLERGDNFTQVKRVYGNLEERTERIINTYLDRKERNVNTGVLLSGIKGSGKTLQAKVISNKLRVSYNIPTIIVSDAFDSAMLSLFLKDITDPAVILFEEFEKMYKSFGSNDRYRDEDVQSGSNARIGLRDSQEGLLTLLDGVMNSNKLFIFTCNSHLYVNDLLLNRPGRVWYHFKYLGLDEDVIKDYCKEKLKNVDYMEQIQQISDFLDEGFTFDVMASLVEEVNRYEVEPLEAVQVLNIEPQPFSSSYEWTVSSSEDCGLEAVNSKFVQITSIPNYLSKNPINLDVYIKVRNAKDRKLLRELINVATSNLGTIPQRVCSSESASVADYEDNSVGFSRSSDSYELHRVFLVLDRNDLVSSSKKVLVYKKFGFTFTFTKIRERNYWSGLGSSLLD